MTHKKALKYFKRFKYIYPVIKQVISNFNIKDKSISGTSFRTSITLPHSNTVDLDIHPIFKSRSITDEEKKEFTLKFLDISKKTAEKLKFKTDLIKKLKSNIDKHNVRPFDIKICFEWDKNKIKPLRYTIYINYNSTPSFLSIIEDIFPSQITETIKKTQNRMIIDTLAADVYFNKKKNWKIYFRKKYPYENGTHYSSLKVTSIYYMKSFPHKRQKIYIHFQKAVELTKFLRKNFPELFNTNIKKLKIPRSYFIGYSLKPSRKVTLYIR